MQKLVPLSLSLFSLIAVSGLQPAHAVVLEQKWQTGQQLAYNVALDGTLNLQTAADVPVLWAGMPLEIQVKGNGEGQLETLSVDNSGTGTVAVKVPKIAMQGEALGQKAELQLQDGKSKFLLNGKVLSPGTANAMGANGGQLLSQPPVAIKITRQGKLAGVEKLPAADGAKAETKKNDAPVALENAIDKAALTQALILRAIPALWPGKDIAVGETWDAVVPWPMADGTLATQPLGQFTLTLKDSETVNGRTLHRVSVEGNLKLDEAKLAQINQGIDKARAGKEPAGKEPAPKTILTAAGQDIRGDIWFDAAAGQIARAELLLNSRTATRNQKPGAKPGGQSWADFTGTLQLELKPGA